MNKFSYLVPMLFLKNYWEEVIKIPKKFILGDCILNSHDPRDCKSIAIRGRNLMLVTVSTVRLIMHAFRVVLI